MRNSKRARDETSDSHTDSSATETLNAGKNVDAETVLSSAEKKRRVTGDAGRPWVASSHVASSRSARKPEIGVARDANGTVKSGTPVDVDVAGSEKVDCNVPQSAVHLPGGRVGSRAGTSKVAPPGVSAVLRSRTPTGASVQPLAPQDMWTMHDRWDAEREEAERVASVQTEKKRMKAVAARAPPGAPIVVSRRQVSQRRVQFVDGDGSDDSGVAVARSHRPKHAVAPSGFASTMMSAEAAIDSGIVGPATLETRRPKSETNRYRSQAGDHCGNCGRTLRHMFSENTLMCVRCKWSVPYYASLSGTPAFVEETEQPTNVQERVRSFKMKLLQYSEDRPTIPQRYWHAVHAELVCNSMLTAHQIKPGTVEQIARELGLPPEIQACSVYMANTFAGLETAVFTHDECAILAQMFLDFKTVFTKLRRKGNAKFPKHNYYMYQFCMARRWYRRARTFPLLKDRRTLEEADRDYAPVAKILKWDFIRSI